VQRRSHHDDVVGQPQLQLAVFLPGRGLVSALDALHVRLHAVMMMAMVSLSKATTTTRPGVSMG
jgi:hypothetical protein